ncbi:biotin transporter BioY [uncultured Tessaracoccus sp.]|uniref:biotin transporter BioY n=1 Tax=uncultured Tessaracoccus sp. TaxID=905023 RepID=UPI0025FDAE7A|nr:biotin transporter BioY [uncultured Tessaracoccus sp.]
MTTTSTARAESRGFAASDLAYVAVFAALIAALSLVPAIPVGGLGVPITLQTLAISLTALIIGPWKGAAAVALYIAAGAAGLPVFANGKAGVGVLLNVSGGYLISFILYVIVVGLAARWILRGGLAKLTGLWLLLALVAARLVVIWPIGVAGMVRAGGLSWGAGFAADVAFWPGDLLKSIVAVAVALVVYRAFPALLRR